MPELRWHFSPLWWASSLWCRFEK